MLGVFTTIQSEFGSANPTCAGVHRIVTSHQLRFNLKCIQSDADDASSMVGTAVADRLIYNLQKEPDLSFIMLTAEAGVAEELLTI